jgi:hypothetical protein
MKVRPVLFGLSLALVSTGIAVAQDSTPTKPPAVLQITREWFKPGKTGMVHDKSEAAFVTAMNKGKLQGHYVALNSLSGKARALYITRYPSFEAWEADSKLVEKDASLSAELDRDAEADGTLLDGLDQAVFTYDEALSYHPHSDISHARYYEITVFHMRPGHHKDWYEVTKMYKDALDKASSSAHWATYEVAYGNEAGTFISLTARNSMTEIDQDMANFKKVMEAAGGDEGMAKLDALFGQAVDSSRTELFSVNPKQSYAEEAWIKADPDFWKPKAAAAKSPSAAAAKPAPAAAAKPASR